MLPLVILPIAGLFLGLGEIFSNHQIINYFNLNNFLGESSFLGNLFTVLKQLGNVIFTNLSLIFAICISSQIAKKEKSAASLISIISFLTMHQTISSLLTISKKLQPGALYEGSLTNIFGINSLDMGIFGGIIVGIGVGYIYNKLLEKNFSGLNSFLEKTKLILMICFLVYIIVGILLYFIWPIFQNAVYSLIKLVTAYKYAGTLLYGLIERILKPFGLNKVFCYPFWQTSLGGSEIINNNYITGAKNIFLAELTSSNVSMFNSNIIRFMSGSFPFIIFGLPAGALAMYHTTEDSKKKALGIILLPSALVCMIVGVTEPLEYLFLFSAPLLYGLHCILAGISFLIMKLLKVAVGTIYSGGIIDFFFCGILQGNNKTNWIYAIILGVVYAAIYYFLFKFTIRKFKLNLFDYKINNLK